MTSPVEWVKFFEGAEIPHVTALEYAVTFADQRISFDMLADLDKEYLKDMGITRTGDVINILKHAKVFDSRLAALKVAKPSLPVPEEPKKKPSTNPVKSLAPAREVMTVVETPKPEPRKTPIVPEPAVTQRLGPPVAKPFSAPQRQIKTEKHGVFSRLGAPTREIAEKGEGSSSQPSLQGDEPKTVQSSENAISSLKRKSGEMPSRGKVNTHLDIPQAPAPVYGKRRLVLVKTLPDGSKTKEIISPDDPIVQRVLQPELPIPDFVVRWKEVKHDTNHSFQIPVHKVIVPRSDPNFGIVGKSSTLNNIEEQSRPSLICDRTELVSVKDRLSPRPPADAQSRLGPPKSSSLPRAVGRLQGRLAPRKAEVDISRKEFRRITPPRDSANTKAAVTLANRLGAKQVSKDERVARERSPHGRSHHSSAYHKTKSVHDRLG